MITFVLQNQEFYAQIQQTVSLLFIAEFAGLVVPSTNT